MKRTVIVLLLILSFESFATTSATITTPFKGQGTVVTHSTTIDLSDFDKTSELAISGMCQLLSINDIALFRAILVTSSEEEYLVAEINNFLDSGIVTFSNLKDETTFSTPVKPAKLKIVLINAKVRIDNIFINPTSNAISDQYVEEQKNSHRGQLIEAYSQAVTDKGLLWKAGETDISRMSYAQRKNCLYRGSDSCFLYGLEYYKDGIFYFGSNLSRTTHKDTICSIPTDSSYIDHFDWRRRHGKNWNTSIKNQLYPHQKDTASNKGCWAFSSIALMEAYSNIYFNNKIDLDLSEQEIISCANTLFPSYERHPIRALIYADSIGVVSNSCFPFVNLISPCSDGCGNSTKLFKGGDPDWRNNNGHTPIDEQYLESELINKGPITIGIDYSINDSAYQHAMLLVGYGTIKENDTLRYYEQDTCIEEFIIPATSQFVGKRFWIFKDSYGIDNFRKGYIYAIFDSFDRISESTFFTDKPIVEGQDSILCEDLDEDGYYNWGIGPKPIYCPPCPDEPDGNDYNPNIGGMNRFGKTMYIGSTVDAPYIKGPNIIGCSGKYFAMNIPVDAEVVWSVLPMKNRSNRTFNISGTNIEAMVRIRQTTNDPNQPNSNGASLLKATYTINNTTHTLSKIVYVAGNISPSVDYSAIRLIFAGIPSVFRETNCSNLPDSVLKWDLSVPGVGEYTQYGHTITVTPTSTGNMSITVTNLLACRPESATYSFTCRVSGTSIPSLITNNPADNILNIKAVNCSPDFQYKIEIYNSQGLKTESKEIIDYTTSNTSACPPGVYTINLYEEDNLVDSKHFVINH